MKGKTKKCNVSSLSDYGLLLTIADVTENGKKLHKNPLRNFHEWFIELPRHG